MWQIQNNQHFSETVTGDNWFPIWSQKQIHHQMGRQCWKSFVIMHHKFFFCGATDMYKAVFVHLWETFHLNHSKNVAKHQLSQHREPLLEHSLSLKPQLSHKDQLLLHDNALAQWLLLVSSNMPNMLLQFPYYRWSSWRYHIKVWVEDKVT